MAEQAALLELFGDKQLQNALLDLADNSAWRVMRPSISKALNPVKQQAKANVDRNKRSGALRRAISKKVQRKRGKKNKAWGKVFVKSKPQEWNGKTINPAKYAHLLEFGTVHSRPYPFLRVALSQKRGAIQRIMITEGWKNMSKFAGKLRRKHNTMDALRKGRRKGRRLFR